MPRREPLLLTALLWAGCNGQRDATILPYDGDGGLQGVGDPGTSGKPGGLPCDVQQLLSQYCWSCHSSPPVGKAPTALVGYADLAGPSVTQPAKSMAQVAVERMQNANAPMPPSPPAPTPQAIASFAAWVSAGLPMGNCTPPDGGTNPYDTPTVCTSMNTEPYITDDGSSGMNPGVSCARCHSVNGGGEARGFEVAGTVYPSAHEPDLCAGAAGVGATVVITGADGQVFTLQVGYSGNFNLSSRRATVARPYKAEVHYQGRVRAMATPQTNGDCNSCHTVTGANGAPGRVMLP